MKDIEKKIEEITGKIIFTPSMEKVSVEELRKQLELINSELLTLLDEVEKEAVMQFATYLANNGVDGADIYDLLIDYLASQSTNGGKEV